MQIEMSMIKKYLKKKYLQRKYLSRRKTEIYLRSEYNIIVEYQWNIKK